jgi:hypothetical protein
MFELIFVSYFKYFMRTLCIATPVRSPSVVGSPVIARDVSISSPKVHAAFATINFMIQLCIIQANTSTLQWSVTELQPSTSMDQSVDVIGNMSYTSSPTVFRPTLVLNNSMTPSRSQLSSTPSSLRNSPVVSPARAPSTPEVTVPTPVAAQVMMAAIMR